MKGKCLIVDEIHPSMFSMLAEIGWDYDYRPEITRSQIKEIVNGYEGLIVRSKTFVDSDLLGQTPTLKFVGRAGAGVDNIDLDFLEGKGIQVVHAAQGNKDAVGEFSVGLLLALLRNIPRSNEEVKKFIWKREENRGEELIGKTVSIIGFGNMGQAFAQRLAGFGCKVFAYDKYKVGFNSSLCQEVDLEKVFRETDILSLHIPLTDETRFMINLDFINRFHKNFILLNTARGEVIRLSDLAKSVESGKIRGAALDVLENEKLVTMSQEQLQSFNSLRSKSNVIFSPHIAGWTFESHIKINVALINKISTLNF
jgi:D-3-phosphoglycerate dehydrogenase / 2-oxoglutarate reductase